MDTTLSQLLRRLIEKSGKSANAIAGAAGLNAGNLYAYSTGAAPLPLKHVPRLARALGLDASSSDFSALREAAEMAAATATKRAAPKVAELQAKMDANAELLAAIADALREVLAQLDQHGDHFPSDLRTRLDSLVKAAERLI